MTYGLEEASAGRLAANKLSEKAFDFYKRLKPFILYEYKTLDGVRYAYEGCIGEQQNLTFEELEGAFEELHRLLME